MSVLPLGVTMGHASGLGPEIVLRAIAAGELPQVAVVFGDLAVLEMVNEQQGLGLTLAAIGRAGEWQAGMIERGM